MFASLHLIWSSGCIMTRGRVGGEKGDVEEHLSDHVTALEVQPTSIKNIPWKLPPSKSHIIRKLALCALSKNKHTLLGFEEMGEDAESMKRCLSQMGVKFNSIDNGIEITGVGLDGFKRSPDLLFCGNSGTALRLLLGLTSRLEFTSQIDGDASLRKRNHFDLLSALSALGVKISHSTNEKHLPVSVQGPWNNSEISVHVSNSSQPFSSLLLSTCGLGAKTIIKTTGDAVSRRHSGLTIELMKASGALIKTSTKETIVEPWMSNPPKEWIVPSDASMMAFPVLACLLSQQSIQIENPVKATQALGHEVLLEHINAFGIKEHEGGLSPGGLTEEVDIDLRDANDLLPPLAATLALSGGGRLRGAIHAKHKESNRIDSTAKLLKSFGLSCTIEDDGLSIEGGQKPIQPTQIVKTYGDHRIQMTAVLLAMQTGGIVEGPELHKIADPTFLSRLSAMPAKVLIERI